MVAEARIDNGEILFLLDGQDNRMAESGDPCANAVEITKVTGKPALISRGRIEELRQPNRLCDIAQARDLLGFEPHIFLAQGAHLSLNWDKKANWL